VKGAYIYDGAGWQSLKGPPGPSTPSADAGNALTLGSDGLLMYREPQGDVQFSGEWSPIKPVSTISAEGYWTRIGDVVTVLVSMQNNGGPGDQSDSLSGLPFSIAEFFSPTSGSTGQFASPVLSLPHGVVGWALGNGQQPDSIQVTMKEIGLGTALTFTLTYITDDARIG
jgi:hypothetical protein